MPNREFLHRRNGLWRRLRQLPPDSGEFGDALAELCALIGWDRARVLSGLGYTEDDLKPGDVGPGGSKLG